VGCGGGDVMKVKGSKDAGREKGVRKIKSWEYEQSTLYAGMEIP
jgi:hypothetical protein